MGQIFLENFKYGMDRRRKRAAGVNGTLWLGKNVVISRGGDVERSKRFVPTYTLPAGATFGLGAVHGQLFTFGSVASPAGLPVGVQYQRLQSPDGTAMVQAVDVKTAGGKLYVIARFASGHIYHFYNGTRITDWDALADANTDMPTLAAYLADLVNADSAVSAAPSGSLITITANVAGTPFTLAASTVDHGGTADQSIALAIVQPNVAAVAETRATATITITAGSFSANLNRITGISVAAVALMSAGVDWTSSNAATANAVAAQVNNGSATHGYSAAAVDATITLTAAPGTGATKNGAAVAVTAIGDVATTNTNVAGGVAAVDAVAQVMSATLTGTFESTDIFTLTINGTAYNATGRAAGTGSSAYVVKRRVFSPAASLWEYCVLNEFDDWDDNTASSGSGFLNISNEAEGSERLVGAGTYIQQSAVFSRRNIRIYNTNTDATQITLSQPVDNSGAVAARSILAYGTTDLFYLDEPGIRSLKARDASGAAFVNDIGVPLDPFVRAHMDTLTLATIQRACAVVEPRDGRFLLALGERIYVLSYFPGSQISAWTYLEPGFSATDFARSNQQLYVRGGDTVYLYGGRNGTTFPNANETVAEVDLPFVASQPPSNEMLLGFDMAAQGEWVVTILTDPNNENSYVSVGTVNGITYSDADVSLQCRTTHAAFKMTCSAAGEASISNLTMWTDGKEPNA